MWQTLPTRQVKGTLWEYVDESKHNIESRVLEDSFAVESSVVKPRVGHAMPSKPVAISLLEPKRSNMVGAFSLRQCFLPA